MAASDPVAAYALLDDRQVAKILKVSPRTVQAWRRKGVGPAFLKVEGSVRYRPQDLQEYLAAAVGS